MKKTLFKTVAALLILCFLAFSFAGCYGSFQLTYKLYKWNGSLGDKFVNTVVMWVLMIIPVYSIAGLADFIFLNLIEFWSGTNPMAMGPNDQEIQTIEQDGKTYQITATQNRYDIAELAGPEVVKKVSLVYCPESRAWYAESAQGMVKLAELNFDKNILRLIHPEGKDVTLNIEN